jgi:large subunit ribosomal protein L7/L12
VPPKRTVSRSLSVETNFASPKTIHSRNLRAIAGSQIRQSTTTRCHSSQAVAEEENGEGTFDANEVSYAFSPPPELSAESKQKVDSIFDKILWLDMIEVHLLTQMVNEKLGISWKETELRMSGGGAGMAKASGASAAAEEPVAAKTIFDLKLVGFDAKAKIKVIKEIRTISGLGLKEAKELVESAPKVIQKELKQDKAEELKAQLEAVGAEVELV